VDSWIVSLEVTVGICAYNEGMNIGKLLNNILSQQDLPAKSEVLVVCSGCTDNTVSIVQQYSKKDSRVHAYSKAKEKEKPPQSTTFCKTQKATPSSLSPQIHYQAEDVFPDCYQSCTFQTSALFVGIQCP
jgi:cellulose synthase/poly-beta-1,6-N-acetylglucosamine synthase-like glycosyltransferase